MKKPQIVRDAEKVARSIFVGIAIPCDKSTVDGGSIRSEKILKFNRKALTGRIKSQKKKTDSRYNGGDDFMIDPVGKPGSWERVEALSVRYSAIVADGSEVSPFGED